MKSLSLTSLKIRMGECDWSRAQSKVPLPKTSVGKLDEVSLPGVYKGSQK